MPDPVEGDTRRLKAATTPWEEIYSNLWGNAEIYGEKTHLLDDITPEHAPFIQITFERRTLSRGRNCVP